MKIYKFRVIINEDDGFLREFELTEDQTLLDFHTLITKNLKLNQSELASFFITSSNWEKEQEFTLLNMGLNPEEENQNEDNSIPIQMMEETVIGDLMLKPKQKMLYEYNFLNPTIFFITLLEERTAKGTEKFPKCVKSEGLLDIEQSLSYLSDFDDIDEFSQTYAGMAEEGIDPDDFDFDEGEDEDVFGSGGGYESDYY
ncbi:MAG: hypothetical protein PHR53_02025 [Bacteroidales bacterium]|nr:hypothetical protein [Bacteroidales bacterium]